MEDCCPFHSTLLCANKPKTVPRLNFNDFSSIYIICTFGMDWYLGSVLGATMLGGSHRLGRVLSCVIAK